MQLPKLLSKYRREYLLKRDLKRFDEEYCKVDILSYPPRHVTIGISSACTNKCVFCAYHSEDAKAKSKVYGLPYKMSLDDFKKIVIMCYEGRVPHIHICATGEPFLHEKILEIIDFQIEIYKKASIQTNFNKEIFSRNNYLDEILLRKEFISYITTDILSGDPTEHSMLKKGSCYEDLLESMEYVSKKSNILIKIHLILTAYNYKNIKKLLTDLSRRRINCILEICNLHPYDFNEYTSMNVVYKSSNEEMTKCLEDAVKVGKKYGIPINIPKPYDQKQMQCRSFWGRFQIWPVKGNQKERFHENVIIGGCNAVVNGNLNSLGYVFDYKNIMELWNNEAFVIIRKNLLKGKYPDPECKNCQSYNGK